MVRKNFTGTEAVAIGRMIETREKPLAEKRERDGIQVVGEPCAGPAQGAWKRRRGTQTRDKVARAVGMGHTRYTQAKNIVAAAEENPVLYGDLPEMMDETGSVSGTYNELKKRQRPPNTPEGAYALDTNRKEQLANTQKRKIVEALEIQPEIGLRCSP